MGHKVNPVVMRVGIIRDWESRWYAEKDYAELLHEDIRIRDFLFKKLKGAGGTADIFEENAVEAVLNAADGTPRMINKLCNASMLIASSRELNCINADAVMQAVSDCELG